MLSPCVFAIPLCSCSPGTAGSLPIAASLTDYFPRSRSGSMPYTLLLSQTTHRYRPAPRSNISLTAPTHLQIPSVLPVSPVRSLRVFVRSYSLPITHFFFAVRTSGRKQIIYSMSVRRLAAVGTDVVIPSISMSDLYPSRMMC